MSDAGQISAVLVQPDPRRKRMQVLVDAPKTPRVTVQVAGTTAAYDGPPGLVSIPFPDYVPWAPGAPHLYELSCCIPDGGNSARVSFGMREVSVIERRLCINQKPIVLKGAGTSARGIALTPLDVREFAKAGFTWIHCDSASVDESVLETACVTGMPVSIALGRDALSMVRNYYNFAALIAWECKDETTAEVVRELDPTRPVIAPQRVLRPHQTAPEPTTRFAATVLTPISRETESFMARAGEANAINFIHVRGFSPPPANIEARLLGDRAAFEAHVAGSIRACVDGLRLNPRLAGYCFDDALAAEAGPERLAAFAEAQAAVRPVISMARSNLVPREEAEVTVTLLNDARLEGRAELSLQVVGPTNQVLWKKKRGVKIPKHGKELWHGTVAASGSVGMHRFVVRVLDERGGRLAESSVSFHVSPPVDRWSGPIDVLDPSGRWLDAIRQLAPRIEAMSPIVVIPPLASSIRAYPDNLLGQALGRIREGAVGIVFDPPGDWDELGATLSSPIDIRSMALLDEARAGSAPLARLHPLFEGLPAGGPLARPYRGLLSDLVIAGESEEDIAPVATWNGGANSAHRAMVRRFGAGRLYFLTVRMLDRLGTDPVVDRLFINLLRHSERRAVATKEIAKVEPRAIEWIRGERSKLCVWRVIGPFPNWDGEGHDAAYPPELGYSADATYAGWFRAAAWQTWHQRPDERDEVPLSQLLRPDMVHVEPYPGTFYAFTDLTSEDRVETRILLAHGGRAKCWLNGRSVEFERAPGAEVPGANVVLKQGRNSVLIKLSVTDSPATFSLRVRDDAGLRWL